MIEYCIARSEEDFASAAGLFREYAAGLDIDLSFQHFNEELQQVHEMYNQADGGIILAKNENEFIACVALRRFAPNTAELKRMYVKPSFRQLGIGNVLLEKAIEMARSLSYQSICLDTLNSMLPAMQLYEKAGFRKVPAYYHNPNATAVYYELKL